jgi:hypothetical protein
MSCQTPVIRRGPICGTRTRSKRKLRPLTVVEQLPRLQGHLVPFGGFALDYVRVATGPMTCAGTPIESGHHMADDDAEDPLGALTPLPLITCLIRVLAPRTTAAAHATVSGR